MGAWNALQNLRRGRAGKRARPASPARLPSREELQREVERLREENERLRQEVADAEKQIAELERPLAGRKKDSTNSSKPPSSDGPAAARRLKPARCRGRRQPGGQKGQPGRHRELEPLERVDQIVPVLPAECRPGGHDLPPPIEQVSTVGEVHRYPVCELPPLRAQIIEYQCHKVACPHCTTNRGNRRGPRRFLRAEARSSRLKPAPRAWLRQSRAVQ